MKKLLKDSNMSKKIWAINHSVDAPIRLLIKACISRPAVALSWFNPHILLNTCNLQMTYISCKLDICGYPFMPNFLKASLLV